MDKDTAVQLKVSLRGILPPIWRRMIVPAVTPLEVLHAILQNAMGWEGFHAYEFIVDGQRFLRDPDPGEDEEDVAEYDLDAVLAKVGDTMRYVYDFGDEWEHEIEVEVVDLPLGKPPCVCVDGARACPPEDCGGPPGYAFLIEALADPDHEEHERYREWLGRDHDPEDFTLDEANLRLQRQSF